MNTRAVLRVADESVHLPVAVTQATWKIVGGNLNNNGDLNPPLAFGVNATTGDVFPVSKLIYELMVGTLRTW